MVQCHLVVKSLIQNHIFINALIVNGSHTQTQIFFNLLLTLSLKCIIVIQYLLMVSV